MNDSDRVRFDRILERVIESLPSKLRDLIDEVPVIVVDRPTPELLSELGIDPSDVDAAVELCGLHSGASHLDQGPESHAADSPNDIHLFREGIIDLAGGFEGPDGDERVEREVRVTLLHEIGHQFGLDEIDLERLGFD